MKSTRWTIPAILLLSYLQAHSQQTTLTANDAYQRILPMAKSFADDVTLTYLVFIRDTIGNVAESRMDVYTGKTNEWTGSFYSSIKDSSINISCYTNNDSVTIVEIHRGKLPAGFNPPPVTSGWLDSPQALQAAYEDVAGSFVQTKPNVRIGLVSLIQNTWQFRFISDTDTLFVILDSKTGTTLSYTLKPVGVAPLANATFELTSLYPQPFQPMVNDKLSIALSAESYGQVSIELFDMLGREYKQIYSGTVAAGLNNLTLSLPSSIPTGIHYLIIKQNGAMSTKPFMVIR